SQLAVGTPYRRLESMDERMLGRLTAFLRKHEFLVELLSWAHPRVDNRNVDLRSKSSHTNHFAGQVVNTNALAHLQHEDVTATRITCRLNDKASSLRNIHKVPGHFRVRDRNRPSTIDLFRKSWHHAAPAAEYVAKANRCASSRPLGYTATVVITDD